MDNKAQSAALSLALVHGRPLGGGGTCSFAPAKCKSPRFASMTTCWFAQKGRGRGIVKLPVGADAPVNQKSFQDWTHVSSAVGKGKIHILSQAVQPILSDFDMRYTNRRVFTRGGAFFMVRTQYFDIFTLKPQKKTFLVHGEKPMANYIWA